MNFMIHIQELPDGKSNRINIMKRMSNIYVFSVLASNRTRHFDDGSIMIEYDLLFEDWPDCNKELAIHKSHLMASVNKMLLKEGIQQ